MFDLITYALCVDGYFKGFPQTLLGRSTIHLASYTILKANFHCVFILEYFFF